MNSVDLLNSLEVPPGSPAFFPLGGKPCDFGTFFSQARRAEASLSALGIGPGDSVLLADSISSEFFALVTGALARGATLLLVEPFLPLREIDRIVDLMRPKLFVASLPGRVWGLRSRSIRSIRTWRSAGSLAGEGSRDSKGLKPVPVVSMKPDDAGIITFTTGTTGQPKGVVRTHAGLRAQNEIIRRAGEFDRFTRPDLAVFANLVLANLGMGRGTVFVPPGWKNRHLMKLKTLPEEWLPETLSTGPAFLKHLIRSGAAPRLRSVQVGGALADCDDFEEAFRHFGEETRFLHVYGSSEAEPVAFSDARVAVQRSRNRGFFQVLHLGGSVPGVRIQTKPDGLWVTGEHVCKRYVGSGDEMKKHKLEDPSGVVWHFMGDRVGEDAEGLWFQGRSFQNPVEFKIEQELYTFLGHSRGFLERDPLGKLVFRGEGVDAEFRRIRNRFPEIDRVLECRIVRDRRHRARIDRVASR